MIEKEKSFKKCLRMEICREMLLGYFALAIHAAPTAHSVDVSLFLLQIKQRSRNVSISFCAL